MLHAERARALVGTPFRRKAAIPATGSTASAFAWPPSSFPPNWLGTIIVCGGDHRGEMQTAILEQLSQAEPGRGEAGRSAVMLPAADQLHLGI